MNLDTNVQRMADVVVIGAGGAGMRAAIAAAEKQVKVILITKGLAARSGATPMACPSYQAAFAMEDERDSIDLAFEDTCFEGRYLGDENLILALTSEATERAMDLFNYGVKYKQKPNGKFLQVVHPGHSFERNLVINGSGYAMAARLRREVLKYQNVEIVEDVIVTCLLKDGDLVSGLVGLDMRRGIPLVIGAKSIVLATGGYTELWRWTDTEPGLTGDGVFLAYKAGADLIDLEMMLYYPTGLCYPNEVEGTLVQYEGLLTDKYCHGMMLNGQKKSFLPQTDRPPVRDVMTKLMFQEIESGRSSPHGGVFIDLRKSPKSEDEIRSILTRLDSLPYNQLRDLGIDIFDEPIEVKPVTHYTLGGVMINEWAETTVPGLYAAGEVSGNIHGANRTSGNALAETQVFGRRAGMRSAEYALSVDSPSFHHNEVKNEIKFIQSFLEEHPQAYRPIDLKRRVKSIMHEFVHYKRDSLGLQYALESLQTLQDEIVPKVRAGGSPANYNYEWEEAIESLFMVQLAQIVAASALAREESRGHHWRTDFPKMRSKWEKHTIARKTGVDSYQITDAPVVRVKDRTKERREPDPHLVAAGLIE